MCESFTRTEEEERIVCSVFKVNTALSYDLITGCSSVYLFDHLSPTVECLDELAAVCFFLSSRRYEYFYLSVESSISRFSLKIGANEFTQLAHNVYKKIYDIVEYYTPSYCDYDLTQSMIKSSRPSSLYLPFKHTECENGGLLMTFKCIDTISEGSFGIISKAIIIETDKVIAVKSSKVAFCPSVIKEIAILSRIKGRGDFVELIHCFHSAFSMSCYSSDLLDNSVTLSLSQRCSITSQLVKAIFTLHCLGYMHRDISLSNILIDESKNVVIADFGSAERIELVRTQRIQDSMPGNYLFAPVEVLEQKRYDESIDVWALGCIVYYLFTFELPFRNQNPNTQSCTIKSNIKSIREKITHGYETETLPKEVYDVLEYTLRIENRPLSPLQQ